MQLRLSTDEVPERKRAEFWHDAVCQEMFHVTPAALNDGVKLRATLDVQIAGRFVLTDLRTTHGSIEKTARDTAGASQDSVLVFQAIEAAHHYRMGRHETVIAPGDIGSVPMGQRFHCATGGIAFRSLLVPSGVLGPLIAGGEVTRTHRLPAASPLGALLAAGLDSVASQLPRLPATTGEAVLRNLSGLVALALGVTEEGEAGGRLSLREARLAAVKRYIDQNLADPTLTPAMVAASCKISVRQLHLLFQPGGETFARYLTQRRLAACRATLSNPSSLGRSVADVAFGWGFSSLSVFYRSFTAAFGISPRSLREAMLTGERPGLQ